VRVPENLSTAVGILSVPLTGTEDSTSLRFTVNQPR